MDFSSFKNHVKKIKIGKILPDAIYLHTSALEHVPPELLALLQKKLQELKIPDIGCNLIKFHSRDFKISLLSYPKFFEEPFPALDSSCTIDLSRNKCRINSYTNTKNPPILHRLETFLHPKHPEFQKLREISKEVEDAGLLKNTKTIGFRQNWNRHIQRRGYELVNGHIVKTCKTNSLLVDLKKENSSKNTSTSDITVQRHLTAIDRYKLSTPMQSLAKHGYFEGKHSIFDYGCGKGDDLRELQAHGLNVSGWDPVYFSTNQKTSADIVNLGYVINVVENPKERQQTLLDAYRLTEKILVISVMLGTQNWSEKFRQYGDGVMTKLGTFQKYYTQQELRNYIETVLGKDPVAVGPGLFYVFRDSLEEQIFLLERQRRKFEWTHLSNRQPKFVQPKIKETFFEKNKDLFEDFWAQTLYLGRLPGPDEFEFLPRIRAISGSPKRAHEFLCDFFSRKEFEEARQKRKDDLLVYFALSLFGKKTPYTKIPEGLKRDVKEFFVSYPTAIEQARKLLFSAGNPEQINEACEKAFKEYEIGFLEPSHSLQFHRKQLNDLPPILRVYVGCGTQLYGDIDRADLIKIHIRSGKVTLLIYDDFENKPIPELIQRIKIKLREQDIDFFDYSGEFTPKPLYFKSRFVPHTFPLFTEQQKFDSDISKLNLFQFSKHGPNRNELIDLLRKEKLEIRDFKVIKK